MNQNRKATSDIRERFRGQTFLDPTYDPAFRELFAKDEALIDFLNGLLHLEGERRIMNISFNFGEHIRFRTPEPKDLIFDIFATTGDGRFLDIELQRAKHTFFIDRMLLYNAFLAVRGKQFMDHSAEFKALSDKVREKRRYELPEIISIWLCNFELDEMGEDYIDEWQLYSQNSIEKGLLEPISEKIRYIVVSLPRFPKSPDSVHRPEDAWLYLLSSAGNMEQVPDFGNAVLTEAMERIRVDSVTDDLLDAQEKDMVMQEEIEARLADGYLTGYDTGYDKGFKKGQTEGRDEGRAEGRAEGRDEERKAIARAMLNDKVPIPKIMAYSGLSEDEISHL